MRRVFTALFVLTILIPISVSFAGVCGDVNADGKLNLLDVSSIINHLYRGGSELNCGTGTDECGDVNSDAKLNLLDVSYIINYLYRGGPKLLCNTVKDIDGNIYNTVRIGNQWWIVENLRVTHYRNGEEIPQVNDNTYWSTTVLGAYCEYNNDVNNVAIYGRLYNWNAVNDNRGIAPAGWHVPSDAEWQTLVDYLDGGGVAGGKMKEGGTAHWIGPNTGATNESGFTALPGGNRGTNASYSAIGTGAFFWSSTESNGIYAWYRCLNNYSSDIYSYDYYRRCGFSIRCVKD